MNSSSDPLGTATSLLQFVRIGLQQDSLRGLRELLESVAKECGAFGCVLWEATEDLNHEQGTGSLVSVSQWFPAGDFWRDHRVPVGPATARGMSLRTSVNIEDIRTSPFGMVIYPSQFIEVHDVTRVLLIPVEFRDGSKGCLSVFRQTHDKPFSAAELERAKLMASLIPDLYETIRDEVAYRLTRAVGRRLQDANVVLHSYEAYRESVLALSRELCDILQANLHAIDVSMFLSFQDEPAKFELTGTTLPRPEEAGPLILTEDDKSGLSGAALRGASILIPDLSACENANPAERQYAEYVGRLVTWPDTPLSFIAVPIFGPGQEPLGVIRCCAPVDGAMYFTKREQQLMTALAAQMGQFFRDSRGRWKMVGENIAWRAVSVALQSVADTIDSRRLVDGVSVIRAAVDAIHEALGDETRVTARIMPRPGDPADIIHSSGLTSAPSKQVTAGIGPAVGDRHFGVLTIEYPSLSVLAGNFQRIADIFGLQIGQYYQLARMGEQQQRALMSFQHQIRAPLRHAVRRFPLAIKAARNGDSSLQRQLQYLNGISRRAYRIAMTMQLFSRLESGLPIELTIRQHSFRDLQKSLIEAVMDNGIIADPSRDLRFTLDGTTFDRLPKGGTVALDKDLVDEAINNLLDNASRYSFPGTEVRVDAKLTKSFFIVTVSNTGMKITHDQAVEVLKKGLRGPMASMQVAEGNGLGLWIVDEIMRAHKGKVEVIPTTQDNLTQVRLLFPAGGSI